MRDEQDFDIRLRAALATYADPGPETGLEQRVVAHIQSRMAAEPRSASAATGPRRWRPWAIALPLAAGVLLGILLPGRAPKFPPAPIAQAAPASPATTVTARSTLPAHVSHPMPSHPNSSHRSRQDVRAVPAPPAHPAQSLAAGASQVAGASLARPKLDVFPTPQPLTAEERALALVATQSPAPLRRALVEAEKQDDAPIRIADIRISPLDLPDQDQP